MITPARLIRACFLTMPVLGLLGQAVTANAGTIFLSGDITPIFSLTDSIPNSATAGNQQFFTNILAGGTEVVVLSTLLSTFVGDEADEFYDGLVGVTSTLQNNALSVTDLADIDLLLIPVPDDAFSIAEIAAISGFLDAGGSLFISGDGVFPATNAIINDTLSALGIGLSLDSSSVDTGPRVATGIQIASNPFTSGVSAFNYGATSTVTGGRSLFFTTGGDPFVAFVPEPSTALLLGIGLAFLSAKTRHGF